MRESGGELGLPRENPTVRMGHLRNVCSLSAVDLNFVILQSDR